MHIGFRTSGGRGEYEVVASHSGYTAASLEGWSFYMSWPDGRVRDTGLWLDPGDSGKPRLRSVEKPPFQIGRTVAAMLLLPDPTRSFKDTPASLPVVQRKKYTVTQVGFGPESEFSGVVDRVTFVPSWIELANSGGSEAIGVSARCERITAVHEHAAELPDELARRLSEHRAYLESGRVINGELVAIVHGIDQVLSSILGGVHAPGTDILPSLEVLAGIVIDDGPDLPPPNELSEDEPEINVRSAHQFRLAKTRGPAGRAFSERVRRAYNDSCAFCGATFSGIPGVRSGIDAAHILAWSKHDLDLVSNGIALCKLHHWAFDAGVLLPRLEQGSYVLRFTTLSERLDASSRRILGVEGQSIPEDRLPLDRSQWPSRQYLDLAYADLGISFVDSA